MLSLAPLDARSAIRHRSHSALALDGGFGNATANLPPILRSTIWAQDGGQRLRGGAGGHQFRSAPLWGVGQRIFFLHDGRTNNLVTTINAHGSTGSEANASLNAAAALSLTDQQNLINFLRSL